MNKWKKLYEYYEIEELDKARQVLHVHSISFKVEHFETPLNIVYQQHDAQTYQIFVKESDFEKALNLIFSERTAEEEEPSYLIEDFRNDELRNIISSPNEWHEQFVLIAKKELENRGVNIEEFKGKINEDNFIEGSSSDKTPSRSMVIFLWFSVFTVSPVAIIGGFLLWKAKVRDDNNKENYFYAEKYRSQGYVIFLISMFFFLIYLISILISVSN